jgi:hypothetical protein
MLIVYYHELTNYFNIKIKKLLVEGYTYKYIYGFEIKTNNDNFKLGRYKIFKRSTIEVVRIEESLNNNFNHFNMNEKIITEKKDGKYSISYTLKTN